MRDKNMGLALDNVAFRVSFMLVSEAQNEHMINGHYTDKGNELLEASTDVERLGRAYDALSADNARLREALDVTTHATTQDHKNTTTTSGKDLLYTLCKHPTACKGPNCPRCGYTRGDAQLQRDHRLCKADYPGACADCLKIER